MTDITIPPEALEAGKDAAFAWLRSYMEDDVRVREMTDDELTEVVSAACLAMLKAWPGMILHPQDARRMEADMNDLGAENARLTARIRELEGALQWRHLKDAPDSEEPVLLLLKNKTIVIAPAAAAMATVKERADIYKRTGEWPKYTGYEPSRWLPLSALGEPGMRMMVDIDTGDDAALKLPLPQEASDD